jgi:hypothetical protein
MRRRRTKRIMTADQAPIDAARTVESGTMGVEGDEEEEGAAGPMQARNCSI